MSDNPGTNVAVYFSPDQESFVEEFDAVADRVQEDRAFSRSEAVREAMHLYVEAIETMENLGWPVDDMSEHARRATIRQALLTLNESEES